MKKLILLLVWIFALFYRPADGTRAWSLFAAYDSRKAALKETENFGKGGDYEFRIVPMFSY